MQYMLQSCLYVCTCIVYMYDVRERSTCCSYVYTYVRVLRAFMTCVYAIHFAFV